MTSNSQMLRELNCAGWKSISISRKDTFQTQDEVTAHNEYGVRRGCWPDPKK